MCSTQAGGTYKTVTIGVVLAGGKSRRMGQDKANLLWRQQPLLSYMTQLLVRAGVDRVVVSRNPDLADRFPGAGPLAGIDAVCHAFPLQRLLIVPVDMPLLSVDSLFTLLNCSAEHAHFSGSVLPCVITSNDEVRSLLTALLLPVSGKGPSLTAFFAQLPSLELQAPGAPELANANTAEQWQQLKTFE